MKENDVYKWRYKSDTKDISYHCKECLAVVKKDNDGKLYLADTYWGVGNNTGAIFYSDDLRIDIEYYTNLDEITLCGVGADRYYNHKDIFVLTRQHGCCKSCVYKYIKKGAKRDKEVMEKHIKNSITELENSIRYELDDIKSKKELLEKLDKDYQNMFI